MRAWRLAAVALFAALTMSGTSAYADVSVEILDAPLPPEEWSFNPRLVEIGVGEYVTWSNAGLDAHDVTTDDQLLASGPLLPGEGFSFYFELPGEFSYFCSLHPWMLGKVIVTDSAAPLAEPAPEE